MIYATHQLQEMSDREIDCALCEKVHGAKVVGDIFNGASYFVARTKEGVDFWVPNYCNNPNDIMPLAFERRIAIVPHVKKLYIANFKQGKGQKPLSYFDKNPLRAIACLILIMED